MRSQGELLVRWEHDQVSPAEVRLRVKAQQRVEHRLKWTPDLGPDVKV